MRKVVGVTERHLAAGTLLSGDPLGCCRSLLPLTEGTEGKNGGYSIVGISSAAETTL